MKKLITAIGLALAFSAAAQEEPIITFKTNLANQSGDGTAFHIELGTTEATYFDIDCGYGKTEYEIKPATFDSETMAVTGSPVNLQASADGLVKIYGDASLLDYFYGEGCYIEWIDLGECVNLDVLDLQHNELKALDLSKYTKLSAIYLTDNPFTAETPLVIGDNHPNLAILEVDIVDYISPDFDINTYTELMSFDAYANKTLTHLDPTNCPKLMRLSVDLCPISSLDVSKNPLLTVLNIEDTRITDIDLSNNSRLRELYTSHVSGTVNTEYHLSGLDISKNPNLIYCTAAGNNLATFDVSNNSLMQHLNLKNNRLKSLDVSHLSDLYYLNLDGNDFGFSTLPLPQGTWLEYYYRQREIATDRSYPEGKVLDFSSLLMRDGTATDAVLYGYNAATDEATALGEEYYTFDKGIVTLNKAYADSVYVSFGNSSFPDARLNTGKFMVKTADEYGKPSRVANFATSRADGKEIAFCVGLSGATAESPRTLYVDFGDGVQVEYSVATDGLSDTPNVRGIKKGYGAVYLYIPENEVLTAFGADGIPMYSINFKQATELRHLKVTGAGLTSADLSMNRCLQTLDLSGNRFTTLSLEGANGVYGKNVLSHINLSNNKLTDVTLNDTRTITHLDLSGNNLTEFGYKEFDNMVDFDLSDNKLTTVNIAYMTVATRIDVSGNELQEVLMPETHSMATFDIRNNKFTFANLPVVEGCPAYLYAPQADIVLPEKGPGVNLSAQNRVIDGVGTTFVWMKEDGTPLTAGQVQVTDGKTLFLDATAGKVYCRMTNPAFPAFDGEIPFRTTLIETAALPSNLVATFTTTAAQDVSLSLAAEKEGTTLYIDWSGEGYNLESYLLTDTYTLFDAVSIPGANVKVYTYDPSEKITVFSISGASMSDMDASGLKDLICLNVGDAGLSEITLPAAPLRELYLDGNEFESLDLSAYTSLTALALNNNKFKSIDLSGFPELQLLSAGSNGLESVTFDNPQLWFVGLGNNNLSTIDLAKAPSVEQLSLSSNNLAELDITPLHSLRQLVIDHNRFTFATLPLPQDKFVNYLYVNQNPVKAVCADGKVDLADQAMVGDVATEYTWYIGLPEFDENGELVGEDLYEGTEYTLEEGVTTFLSNFDGVVCVMTNSVFPNLYLHTEPLDAVAGVSDAVAADCAIAVTVRDGEIHVEADVADGTPVAVIALDGRTLAQTTMRGGRATLRAAAGTSVLAVGNRAVKVAVK